MNDVPPHLLHQQGYRCTPGIFRHNTGVLPAVLNGLRSHHSPGPFCNLHRLQEIDFVDVWLICIVEFNCTLTEKPSVPSFEAPDSASIKQLDVWCDVGCKIDNFDVLRHIIDEVSGEIVNEQKNVAIMAAHINIKLPYPPGNVSAVILSIHSQLAHISNKTAIIQAFLLLA
jgi:hypothetical protein